MQISLRGPSLLCWCCAGDQFALRAAEVQRAVASNFAAPMERIVALFRKESGLR